MGFIMAKFVESEFCNINLENILSIKIVKVGIGFIITLLDVNKVPFMLSCDEHDATFHNLTRWIKENSLDNSVAIYDHEDNKIEPEHLR